METLGILDEIEYLVSDKLQVVSYKWLSRHFLVSSDAAKRLLQEFVMTRGNSFQVIYTLSGWMKNDPMNYQVKLVSGSKLDEAKQKFDASCSVQVYSVQSCIPKDPAALWNIESVQAEELFKQPSAVENCLRDNRFCGILSSFVRRSVDGTSTSIGAPQCKTEGMSGPSKISLENSAVQHSKLQESSPVVAVQSLNVDNHVKTESKEARVTVDGGNVPLPGKKKRTGSGKTDPGNGGALANLWGQSSGKPKPCGVPSKADLRPIADGEAQTHNQKAMHHEDSDDEAQDANFRCTVMRESNRKRRVVLDCSDDEIDEAIDLASPDLPKERSSDVLVAEKPFSNKQVEHKPKVEEKSCNRSSNQVLHKDSSNQYISSKISEKIHAHGVEKDSKENLVSNGTSNLPKRRKILKTRIDERGREVTEVVWEGEDTEVKEDDTVARKAESIVPKNSGPASKKSPAVGSTAPNPGGKAGNKKGGNKDPKQGNIMSFFKKV